MKTPTKIAEARSKFETRRQELESFRHENEEVFDTYDRMCESYNEALSDMKKLIHENVDLVPKRLGDFKIVRATKIDTDSLVAIIGEEECVDRGYVEKKFSIQRQAYESAAKRGDIAQEVVDVVELESTPRVYGPKPVVPYIR